MARPSNRPSERKFVMTFGLPEGTTVEGSFRPTEDRAEKRHRLRKDSQSFWIKEASVYVVGLIVLSGTAIYYFWVLSRPGVPREDRQWVMGVLEKLLVGIVGYVFGKATK